MASPLGILMAQRSELSKQYTVLNNSLSGKRGKAKRDIKKQIRNIKSRLRKLDRAIKRADKEESIEILATQGIDSRGDKMKAVTASVTSVAQSALGKNGIFGDKGVFSRDRSDVIDANRRRDGDSNDSLDTDFMAKYGKIIAIAGGFIALLLILMARKK